MGKNSKILKRIREWTTIPGNFQPGQRNSITDVSGVTVGQVTVKGDGICTGVTIISPASGDVFTHPIPAAVAVGNGFGKLVGALQVEELGEIESFIGLTNTLSVAAVLQGLINYHAPKMPEGRNSINVIVGETNDSRLNDIRRCHITPGHVAQAIAALSKDVKEGSVGAGAGTVCFGFKGGIGTSSRVIPGEISGEDRDYTVGALVQSNYGGNLNIFGKAIPNPPKPSQDGSCMIVILTDAPLSAMQLKRVAKRGLIGMTNTGSFMSHGSGDFAIAASNYEGNRGDSSQKQGRNYYFLSDSQLNPFFEATVETVQEALYNSLTMAAGASKGEEIYPGFKYEV
ncbi:MAG: P1 family peptidase [Firmicutes bacterium]|nr:P1 family peptidase [Bacillota bacterium]